MTRNSPTLRFSSTGKTLSSDGHKAATEMANLIVKQIQAARAPASHTKK